MEAWAIFGTSVSGFFFLALWIRTSHSSLSKSLDGLKDSIRDEQANIKLELEKRVDFKWLESCFKKDIKDEISEMKLILTQIKDTMTGTVEKKGAITKLHELDDRLNRLEKSHAEFHKIQ